MKVRITALAILVLAGIGVIIYQHHGLDLRSEPDFTVHPAPAMAVEPEPPDFAEKIQAALKDGRYAELDAAEARYRSPDVRFIGGISKIERFYQALSAYDRPIPSLGKCHCTGSLVLTTSFTQAEARLEAWHKANPKSIAAVIALADIWHESAWNARGGNWADDVSDAQWEAVGQRLSQAEYYLIDADPQVDPEVFDLQMSIGVLRSFNRARQDAIYQRAITRFPNFYRYYEDRAFALQENWFGDAGELARYLDDLRRADRGNTGQVAYSFAAYQLMILNDRNDLFTKLGLNFRAVIAAYQVRERLYGLSNRDWNAVFNLSIQGLDCKTGHVALEMIGDRWDPEIWGTKDFFDTTVTWFHAHSAY